MPESIEQLKVCENCFHVTTAPDEFLCVHPANTEPHPVRADDKQECFWLGPVLDLTDRALLVSVGE